MSAHTPLAILLELAMAWSSNEILLPAALLRRASLPWLKRPVRSPPDRLHPVGDLYAFMTGIGRHEVATELVGTDN